MKHLERDEIIKKSGAQFKIIDVTDEYYLAEVVIDKRIDGYEVGVLRSTKASEKIIPKHYKTIPSSNQFGTNSKDKYFQKRFKSDAVTYFTELVG